MTAKRIFTLVFLLQSKLKNILTISKFPKKHASWRQELPSLFVRKVVKLYTDALVNTRYLIKFARIRATINQKFYVINITRNYCVMERNPTILQETARNYFSID